MNLILLDSDKRMCDAWETYFPKYVEIRNEKFKKSDEYNIIITPGNSFGIMDGGFDAVLKEEFGEGVEIGVGVALGDVGMLGLCEPKLVWVDGAYVIYVPTMFTPEPIKDPKVVYYAMLNALVFIDTMYESDDMTAVCPGIGTGWGKVPHDFAASLMALAYNHYIRGRAISITAKLARIGELNTLIEEWTDEDQNN